MSFTSRRALAALIALTLTGALLGGLSVTPSAEAATPTGLEGFTAGNLISDAAFYNAGALTAQGVADVIAAKGSGCVNNSSAGVPCLKNYRQNTPKVAATAYCAALSAASNSTAASIVSRVTKACKTSPAVMLAMIQKESALLTKSGSSLTKRSYATATGAGCPDFATCDASLANFFNQVYKTASMFSRYRAEPWRLNYPVGTNKILYNPETTCGRATVEVTNIATGALYTYTPYAPNVAALDAVTGTGDACSAYGNRNFYRLMKTWFPKEMNASTARPAAPSPAATLLPQLTNTLDERTAIGSKIGTAQGPMTCASGFCSKPYANGHIYAAGSWARSVLKPIDTTYRSLGGPTGALGIPLADAVCSSSTSCKQTFQGGTITSSGGTTTVSNAKQPAWTRILAPAKDVAAARITGGWEMLRVGADDAIYRRTYLAGVPSDWVAIPGVAARKIAATTNASGGVELFFIGLNRRVYHLTESSPGGAYGSLTRLDGAAYDLAAAATADGWLVAQLDASGAVSQKTSAGGGWTGVSGTATAIAAASGSDGRPWLYRVNGGAVSRAQRSGGGTFGSWSSVGGSGVTDVALAVLGDGRVEAFTVGSDGVLRRSLDGAAATVLSTDAVSSAATVNSSGTVDLVRVTDGNVAYRIEQSRPGTF